MYDIDSDELLLNDSPSYDDEFDFNDVNLDEIDICHNDIF